MENKKWIRFVESFILLPGLTMSAAPAGAISQAVINVVAAPSTISSKLNNQADLAALNQEAVDPSIAIRQAKADAVDSYFKTRGMPLEGTGMKMVLEAEKNDLDWRLLAAIAVRESTGGKNDCNRVANNPFGWGSCKIGFDTIEAAIETVARNLGGNNPNTAKHYDDKTIIQILHAYNPPSIVPRYAQQVIGIMDVIGKADEVVPPVTASATT